MEFFAGAPDPLDYGMAVLLFGGWMGLLWMVRLIFTGKLCSGRELEAVVAQRNDWQKIALDALGVADRTAGTAEVLHDIAAALPDPGKEISDVEVG